MGRFKVVHIHSDIKFVDGSRRFDPEIFENRIVIVGDSSHYSGIYKDVAIRVSSSRKSLQQIIQFCSTVDMVVLYDLNFAKAYIANRLPQEVVVIWRFFGLELYGDMPNYVYSHLTRPIIAKNWRTTFLLKIKDLVKSLVYLVIFQGTSQKEFSKAAFQRSDYFLGLSEKEYVFLKDFWKDLPPFLQIDFDPYLRMDTGGGLKKDLILLGINRSPYNNHLDILEGIKDVKTNEKYSFLLLFNYVGDSFYSKVVRNEASRLFGVTVLEDFIPLDQFKQLYSEAAALVLNGYRQMGMGNIFVALRKNTKVYLSEKNVMLHWLKDEGFKVFTIDDFYKDLKSNLVQLSAEDALSNQQQFRRFVHKYNNNQFNKKLVSIITDKP